MIKDKYLTQIKQYVEDFGRQEPGLKFFIYGSSLERERFGDIDLGVMGDVEEQSIYELREKFDESTLPYFVDIVNFNRVSDSFRHNVFKSKILWLKR